MRTCRRNYISRSIQALVAMTHRVSATRRCAIMLVLSFVVALTLGVSAMGNEEEEEEHPQPVIENFQAFFDGVDQYSVFGEVTNCDDVEGITVTFGGVFAGYSVETGVDGYFHLLIIHEDATGKIATARATCHEGVVSEAISIDVY